MNGKMPNSRLANAARRAGWALGDQALSSLTNFALGVLVARAIDPDGFGAFTIVFSTYLIVLNVARAIATQPLTIRYSATGDERWSKASDRASGTLLTSGVISGAGCVVAGMLLPAPLGPALIALGIAMPALLVQDGWRSILFAAGRGRDAFLVDLVWAVILVASLVAIGQIDDPVKPILAWGASAAVAAIVGSLRTGVRPRPGTALDWLREHRDLAPRYAAEVGVGLAAAQGAIYVVGAVAGLAEAGSIRAAQLLLGPMHILLQAAYLAAVPEGVRLRAAAPRRFPLAMAGLAMGVCAVILAWVAILLALPPDLGRQLLGQSWAAASVVLLPLGLALAAQGATSGPLVGLRVLADARRSLRARLIDAPAGVLLAVGGAVLGGAIGAAWGFVASGLLGVAIFSFAFARSVRDRARERQSDDVESPSIVTAVDGL